MFDTVQCDYPLPDPRHQDLELTRFGLRRAAALVGYDLWRRALPEISITEDEEGD